MEQKRASKQPKKRHLTVRRGSVTVKIYRTPTKGYDRYTVVYHSHGKRQRESFADKQVALQRAGDIADALNIGEHDVLKLTAQDRLVYTRAVCNLAPSRTPLDVATAHFAEAVKILGSDLVIEAARHYARQNLVKLIPKQVPEVVEELIAVKRADGCSERYLADLTSRLGRFARTFSTYIAGLSGREIDDWVRNMNVSNCSRNNYRRAVLRLVTFAISRHYLPKGWSEMEAVGVAKDRGGEIGIFTPEEMARLLAAADHEVMPFLALGGFAGLRAAEIERLEWSDVKLAEGHIVIHAAKAKTARRRIVPIPPNLAAWLATHPHPHGQVLRLTHMSNALKKLCEKTATEDQEAVKWKHNALRHSFISYRVADIQNVPQVALEAGNSPQIIFTNYRELVTPADAKKWFSISPQTAPNVIPLKQAVG